MARTNKEKIVVAPHSYPGKKWCVNTQNEIINMIGIHTVNMLQAKSRKNLIKNPFMKASVIL
jgi:hypothetical protein